MSEKRTKPIASCAANEVEAWDFPFYLRPATDFEPPFLFLEDHLYNMNREEIEALGKIHRIDKEEDLARLGFPKSADGVFLV